MEPRKSPPIGRVASSRARALRDIASSELRWTRKFLRAAVPVRVKPEALERFAEAIPFTVSLDGENAAELSLDGSLDEDDVRVTAEEI